MSDVNDDLAVHAAAFEGGVGGGDLLQRVRAVHDGPDRAYSRVGRELVQQLPVRVSAEEPYSAGTTVGQPLESRGV